MRWPRRSRDDDALLAETQDRVRRYATSCDRMTDEQRERLRAATLAAFDSRAMPGAEPWRTRGARRGFALAVAIVALVGLVGMVAAAESGPGQPLYGLRLAVESLALPAGGADRTDALLTQLDRRLEEVRQESDRANGPGVVDAVRAYLATLDALRGGVAGDGREKVEEALNRHVGTFRHVLPSAPSNAYGEVQHALQQAEHARQGVEPGEGGPAQSAQPSPPVQPPASAQPAASAKPSPSLQPSPSVQPPASGQPPAPTSSTEPAQPIPSGQPGQPSALPGRP